MVDTDTLEWGPVKWGEWMNRQTCRQKIGVSLAVEKSTDGVNTVVHQRIYTMVEYKEE